MRSWRIVILPYIEQDKLFQQYDFKQWWDDPPNSSLADPMPRTYCLHSEYRAGRRSTITNYVAIVGEQTVWRPGKPVDDKMVKDGTSNTIMLPENRGFNLHWMEPRDFQFETMDWTINSPNGISSKYDAPAVAMLDGSVRRLSLKIAPEVLKALATIDGGEKLSDEAGEWKMIPDGRLRPITEP